jgi:hypothetical protein
VGVVALAAGFGWGELVVVEEFVDVGTEFHGVMEPLDELFEVDGLREGVGFSSRVGNQTLLVQFLGGFHGFS